MCLLQGPFKNYVTLRGGGGVWLSVKRCDKGREGLDFAQALCHSGEFSTHAVAVYATLALLTYS